MATVGGAASTPRPSSTSGPGGSRTGAAGPRYSSTSTMTGRASRSRTPCRSCGGCSCLQALQRTAQEPRHVHLRVANPLTDLPLREVVHEAELEHLTLDLGQ